VTAFLPRVLYVSGPVEPPWTRSDKNLVRDVATHLKRYRARVLTHEGVVGALPPEIETEAAWGPKISGHTPLGRRLGLMGRLLATSDVQLIHLFWPADPVVAQIVRLGARARGVPVIHTLVRAPSNTLGITRMVAGEPVVTLSRETQRRIQGDGIVDAVHIPHGVEPRKGRSKPDSDSIRTRYGIPHGPPLILYCGDYKHAYAARTVAAVLPRVLREIDCHFVMACRILDDDDRAEESRIREAVSADGLSNHVSFLNVVPDLRDLMAVCTVQIFPADSVNERMDMPRVLLEGMAEGLATVVANKAPFEEVVEPGGAIGVPTMQPVTIAAAVLDLLRDPKRRSALATAGRQLVESRFSIARVAERYESLYDRVLAEANDSLMASPPRSRLRETGGRIFSLRPRGERR
jgi:glycosyltransferase involved in cell wall biosynthesis